LNLSAVATHSYVHLGCGSLLVYVSLFTGAGDMCKMQRGRRQHTMDYKTMLGRERWKISRQAASPASPEDDVGTVCSAKCPNMPFMFERSVTGNRSNRES
jgi:hypothetical protein